MAYLLLLVVAAVALVLLASAGLYKFGQAPHRLFKAFAGMAVAGLFLARPDLSLSTIPFVFPFMTWLPISPVPFLNAQNVLMFSLLFGWVGKAVLERKTVVDPSPWNLPLSLFLGWALFSALQGVLQGGGGGGQYWVVLQRFWIAMSGLFLFFLVFNNLHEWKGVRRLAFLVCLGAGLGVVGVLRESRGLGGGQRVGGGVGQLNEAGAFFACATLFTLGLLSRGFAGFRRKLVLMGALAASTIAMILPASRGAFVGFIAGALPQAFRAGVIAVLILALLVVGGSLLAPSYVRDRVLETQGAAESGDYEALNEDAGGRLDFWKAGIKVIAAHPLLGVGFGQMARAMEPYLGRTKQAHNLYVQVAGEMGIIGFVLFLWVLGVGLLRAGDLLKYPGFPRALGLGYGSAMIALLVSNIFGGRLFTFSLAGFVSLTTALVFRARALLLSGDIPPESLPPSEAGSPGAMVL